MYDCKIFVVLDVMLTLIEGKNELPLPTVLELYVTADPKLTSCPFFLSFFSSLYIDQVYSDLIKAQTLFDSFKTPLKTLIHFIQLKWFSPTLTDDFWLYLSQYKDGKYLDLFLLAGYQLSRSALCCLVTAWIQSATNEPLFRLVKEFSDPSDIHYVLTYTSKQFPSVIKPIWFVEAYSKIQELQQVIYDCLGSRRCVGPHLIVQQMLGLAL